MLMFTELCDILILVDTLTSFHILFSFLVARCLGDLDNWTMVIVETRCMPNDRRCKGQE
jgi:hypothetical protein